MRRAACTLVLLSALLPACAITGSTSCTPALTTTASAASMRDPAGTELAQVVVFLVSADPDSVPGLFRMRADLPITGSPLRGHLRSATLIDLHGQPVYQVALETDYNAAIESTRSLHDAALVASLRTRLERDELLVELTTDLPGLGVLRSPLKLDRRITRVDAPLCRHERWPIG